VAADIESRELSTVAGLVDTVEELAAKAEGRPLWFRGCGDSSDALVPVLYRRTDMTATELVGTELELVTMFRQRSIRLHSVTTGDAWEYLFLMQHFGVPTRLLDWTENAIVALYFAVSHAEAPRVEGEPSDRLAVWVLDPGLWNEFALRDARAPKSILSTPDPNLAGYEPDSETPMKITPLAMHGAYNNPRIVAQRGSFVIFGMSKDSMEEHFSHGFAAESLQQLVFSRDALQPLRDSLDALGFTESMIYPDLEGLARELTRRVGLKR
jgi:FRG domain